MLSGDFTEWALIEAGAWCALALMLLAPRLKRFFRRRSEVAEKVESAALHHLQSHDALTALPNRALLEQRVAETLVATERTGGSFAVVVLNLDRFNAVNDSLGRHAGDALLIEVARALQFTIRRTDTVARYGGDEFAIILSDIAHPDDAGRVAAKLARRVAEPFVVGATELVTDVSIGISVYPRDGRDVNTLLSRADAAMRHAKQLGGNQVQYFAPSMHGCTRELALETDLRRAASAGQLELHYQPKVLLASGRVEAAEALMRWRHPVRGLLRPDAFLPMAEETGLIVPMSEWAIFEACRQASAWQREHGRPIQIAVNLSSQQFNNHDLVDCVRRALRAADLSPSLLKLEITEGALIRDPKRVAEALSQLSAMGVAISIDDFGIGYSSPAYLTRFPISELKIDRSFIAGLASDPANATIVRAVISLAHALRLQVVAEGVETEEQRQFLAELGCDQYQGYLCSPPLPAAEFTNFVTAPRFRKPLHVEAAAAVACHAG